METSLKTNQMNQMKSSQAPIRPGLRPGILAGVVLVGAVTAIYVYRRRSGKILPLAAAALSGIKALAGIFQTQRPLTKKVEPEKTTSTFPASQIQMRPMGSVDLDHLPAI